MTSNEKLMRVFQFSAVIIMCILAGAEVDLFIPSFPELNDVFHLSPFQLELTLSINMVAHCFSALFVGTLGDRYGRKPIINIGLLCFIVGSILCSFATSYSMLIIGRFLQGVGISGPAILAYVVVADIYSTKQQQQMMGALHGTVAFAMAFAPVVGSYISYQFGWRGNFHLLLAFGILCYVLSLLFLPKGQKDASVSVKLKTYVPIICSKKSLYYILTICFMISPFWVFVAISPILLMEDLGVKLLDFGFYQGVMALTFALVSFFSTWILKFVGTNICFRFGVGCFILFIFTTAGLILTQCSDPLIIVANMLILSVGVVFPVNILFPIALDSYPKAKAKISALIVSWRLIIPAITIQTISYFYTHSFFAIGIGVMTLSALMLLFCYLLFKETTPLSDH